MNNNLLEKYARLIVKSGVNIQKNQTLIITSPIECAAFTKIITKIAYEEGAKDVVVEWVDELLSKIKFLYAPEESFEKFPEWQKEFYLSYAREGAAFLTIDTKDPELMKNINSERILKASKVRSSALKEYANRKMSGKNSWIIDPIDGTTNFMYGYNHSAISLAFCINSKLEYGFVYNPSSKEMFTAEEGKGAYLNGVIIKVSDNKTLDASLIGFGTSPYEKDKGLITLDIAKEVFIKCRDIRRSGSAALDICYTACGRTDGFFEMTLQPWDFSAASLILKEAGGKITDWKGNSVNILKKQSILASNSFIHNNLLELLEKGKTHE